MFLLVFFYSIIKIFFLSFYSLFWFYLLVLVRILPQIILLLIAIAYLTLAERKIMASMQRRKGPNVVGMFGLLQPLADGLKLLLKETIIPSFSSWIIFLLAPLFTFMCSLVLWSFIPFDSYSYNSMGLLYILAFSSLGVYGILFSGWSSNSKYAFLGGLRSAAQMISYEVVLGLILMSTVLMAGSLNIKYIILYQTSVWFVIPLFPFWILFFICALAETNRAPFDLPEAEAELVAGYNVEYSSMGFALFFLGEYGNIIFMSAISSIFFFGGWDIYYEDSFFNFLFFGVKVAFHTFLFVWVRAAFPRFRYDQLMRLGWKVFLPLVLGLILLETSILVSFNIIP